MLERTIPELVEALLNHRPRGLRGSSLVEALQIQDRQPARLQEMLQGWRMSPRQMYETAPTLVFAAIGQGRADGSISPEEESTIVGKLLTHWALTSTLQAAASYAGPPVRRCGSHAAA